ncbi:MAG TPA: amino acid adenylation domain-containing protein [Aldersonia sp.]
MNAPAAIEDVLALSPLQEGLFTLARLSGDAADPYVIQFVADIDGPLDIALLQRSADAVLARHPNLRVSFWDRDVPRPVQIVPSTVKIPWELGSADVAELGAIAEAERRRHFDLAAGPSIRFLLVDVAPQRYRLICTAHHLIMDGWSVPVFVRELVAAYLAGGSLAAQPAPRLYRDYIAWLAAQDRDRADAVWREHLDGFTAPTMLAARGAADADPDADPLPRKVELNLGRADTAALLDWARTINLTVNTLAQFAWAVVLGRLTDRTDLVFGNTHSGRPDDLAGVESMVGLFINTIPLRVRLDERPVLEQCRDLQRTSARLRAHGYVGLSAVQRLAGHGDLFDTLMVFQNAPRGSVDDIVRSPEGVEFVPVEMESLTHYPLVVVPFRYDDDLVVTIEYRADLLGPLDPESIAWRILHVLRQIPTLATASPRRLDVLLPGEAARILAASTGPVGPAVQTTVHELFERHMSAAPDAPAIGFAGRPTLSYADVDRAANRLAHRLLEAGVRAEDTVAIALPRTPEFVIAILAIAKAGGASVPLDVTAPRERAELVVSISGTRFAVTTDEFADLVPVPVMIDGASVALTSPPAVTVHPDQAAYVIFTSGSTGEPRGVVATHRGVTALLADHAARIYAPATAALGRKLRVGHAWSLVFDASWQPTLALLDGHCVELFDVDEQRDPDRLVAGIIERGVDMIETSPSMFAALGAAGLVTTDPDGTRRCPLAVLGLGGEALGDATWNALRHLPGTRVMNFYGPTETTVDAVVADTGDYALPAIGAPLAGMTALVLDSGLRPVPDDTVAELYLGGPQVTRGYIGRPGDTASRFVPDATGMGRRLYRTGDLVRRRGADGALEYLGRSDDQVKIRGHRIELGEVEAALAALPGVRAAAVVVVARAARPALVGFAVTAKDPARLRTELTDRLPGYLVPTRIAAIDELPTTSNGKLDTRALVAHGTEALASGGTTGPRTDTERAIVDAVAGLLDGMNPGIDDDFGTLGVDSIVAIGVVTALRKAGLGITPRMVLTCPTIRELGAAVDAAAAPEARVAEEDR